MRGFSFIFSLIAFLFFFASRGAAQDTSPSLLTFAGGYAETPDGAISLSWTAGEPFVETVTVGERILTQGFQQNDVFINSVSAAGPPLAVKAFPNPTQDRLRLEFTEPLSAQLELFNLQGIRVWEKRVRGDRAEIDLGGLPAALYLLRVTDAQHRERRFKIQKIH